MRGKKRRVWVAWDDVVCGPRVVGSCAFETDPTVLCGVADCFGSSLVVACVVWSVWFGMESVVGGLAVWASAWVGGEFAAAEAWSRDGHGVVCLLALSTIARQHKQATRRCVACALRVSVVL